MNINIKKIIAGLGIVGAIGGGAFYVFQPGEPTPDQPGEPTSETRPLTWEEYTAVIESYQKTIYNIRAKCATDTRCINRDGVKLINFGNVKSRAEALQKLNQWTLDGDHPKYNRN